MPIFRGAVGCLLMARPVVKPTTVFQDVLQLVELLSPDLTPALAREVGKNQGLLVQKRSLGVWK